MMMKQSEAMQEQKCSRLRIRVNMTKILSKMDQLRDQDSQSVLGQKKLNLILDLDNTLLHAKRTKKLTLEDKRRVRNDSCELHKVEDGSKLVKLRPGVREFLKKASDMFELSIYTMGTRDYAHTMADLLALGSKQDGRSMFWKKIISREDCTHEGQKGLDIVLSDRRVVLIVDDKEDVWEESCRANVIKIAPYCFFEDEKRKREVDNINEIITTDDELKRVLSTLSMIHQMFYEDNNGDGEYMKRDVRRVLEKVRDHEEQKKKDDEESSRRKRLEEAKARRLIIRFCAPVTKRCKRDAKMMTSVNNSPYLV
ncbi:RNA polymerase II C-terminal domain phosphatase-like 4 [Silene latifolia]|uniref:RNA polymerase II C-terminal domain phosphatase-like 4 n=1 Tax=Silene latifolia TaxID=37657 RepID=UPI003D789C61